MGIVLLPAGNPSLSGCLSGSNVVSGLNLRTILAQGGGQAVTTALDQSALVSGLTMLDIQPGSSISIGSAAGAAHIATYQSMIRANGTGGTIKYQPKTTGSHACDRILNLGGNNFSLVSGSTAAILKLEQAAAGTNIDIDDSTRVNVVALLAGSIDQLYAATQNVTWRISGGSFTTARGWSGTGLPTTTGGAACIGGGTIAVGRSDNNITSLPTGGDLIMGGGLLTWRGGNITGIYATGGLLDFRYVPAAMTITNLIVTADVAARSYFKSLGATNLVTVTNLLILGGSLDVLQQ